mgnify:CR=1 FL=1
MEGGFSVYVIKSAQDGRLYVGMSRNITKRLRAHNGGQVFSTKGYRPWKLVYQEFLGPRQLARKREKYYKSGCGKQFIKAIILPQ